MYIIEYLFLLLSLLNTLILIMILFNNNQAQIVMIKYEIITYEDIPVLYNYLISP